MICVPDPAEAAGARRGDGRGGGRGAEDVPALPGLAAGFIHPTRRTRGVDPPAVDGGRFDDVHGAGWRLVTVDTAWTAVKDGAEAMVRLDWRPRRTAAPTRSAVCRWFGEHDATYVLQRPDFYLYGTAPTTVGVSALADDLRARLSATHSSLEGTSS